MSYLITNCAIVQRGLKPTTKIAPRHSGTCVIAMTPTMGSRHRGPMLLPARYQIAESLLLAQRIILRISSVFVSSWRLLLLW